MLLWWLVACQDKTEEPEVEIQHRPDDEGSTESEPSAELEDVDQDGYSVEEGDCDDWDPYIYPGAPEEWNYEDDDCDGYEDIDGIHSGSLSLQAVGIYEGDAYSFEQECTGTTERVEGHLSVSLSCTIDHSQELASLLLGGELEILTEADFVLEEQYSGNALFVSSGGDMEWDSMGSVSLSWSSLEDTGGNSINVYAVLDALYLDVQILGILYRE